MPLLETRKLTIRFGGLTAVDNLNLKVDKGEIRALIGPNGAGKTTFINLLTGVYTPTDGEILFKEQKLTGLQPHIVTKAGIARTFQNNLLYRTLTVAENVMVAQYCRTHGSVLGILLGTPGTRREEKEIRKRALSELEFTGMLDKKDLYPQNLPYGRQRLVEIARALATSPDLLLLDEPAAGMNPQEVDELMGLIGRILERGITILLIEHNMRLVMQVSHRISVLNFGRKIAEGTSEEVQTHEEVLDAYLGRQHKPHHEPGAVAAAKGNGVANALEKRAADAQILAGEGG
jgi:branched-chain amino acid transport system ATP-binding protein